MHCGKDGRFQSWCCLAWKYVFDLYSIDHFFKYFVFVDFIYYQIGFNY